MDLLTAISMGRIKKVKPEVAETETLDVPASPKKLIAPLSIDYGREDLNDIGRKINEIIDHLNG